MRERERERSRGRGSALGAPDLGFPVAHERPRARGGCGAGGQPPAGPGHVAPWPETATAAGDARVLALLFPALIRHPDCDARVLTHLYIILLKIAMDTWKILERSGY